MKHLFFIGMMGSGKTTFSKKVANALNMPWFDSDQEIEKVTGMTVSQLFEEKGEPYFRSLEHQFLIDLASQKTAYVVSTGGGLPCFSNHMELLKDLGTSFYLNLPTTLLTDRLLHAKTPRPLLDGLTPAELKAKLDQLLHARVSYYEQADYLLSLNDIHVSAVTRLLDQRN